jgi:type IV pilus assembly protein PilV
MIPMRQPYFHQKFSRLSIKGFSLIEILVTIVILSFGLLGIAGLLVGGVSNAAASEFNTKAENLLADMADRMRANSGNVIVASSQYNIGFNDPSPGTGSIAFQDVTTWLQAIQAQLPNGQGRIVVDAAGTNRKVTLSIRWNVCLGALSQTQSEDCTNNPDSTYKAVSQEIRL